MMIELLSWAFSGVGNTLVSLIKRGFILKIWQTMFPKEFIAPLILFKVRLATNQDFVKIAEMAEFCLGKGHGVSASTAQKWAKKNPTVFAVVECQDNNKTSNWQFCGYVSVLPLTKTAVSMLRTGKIQDYDLTEESILTPKEAPSDIYIMDLMTNVSRCRSKNCCRMAGACLLNYLRKEVKKIKTLQPECHNIFTLIASKNGARIAEKFGFAIDTEYQSPFGWKLYEKEFDVVE